MYTRVEQEPWPFLPLVVFVFFIVTTLESNGMDAKTIIYGETALDKLVQWLKSTGEPQDLEVVVLHYLDILRSIVLEEHA